MGKRVASKVRSGSTHGTTKESTKVSTKEMTTREKGFESAGKPDALQTLRDKARQGGQIRDSVWSASGLPALSAVPSTAAFEVPLILVAKIPEGCSLSFVPYESN